MNRLADHVRPVRLDGPEPVGRVRLSPTPSGRPHEAILPPGHLALPRRVAGPAGRRAVAVLPGPRHVLARRRRRPDHRLRLLRHRPVHVHLRRQEVDSAPVARRMRDGRRPQGRRGSTACCSRRRPCWRRVFTGLGVRLLAVRASTRPWWPCLVAAAVAASSGHFHVRPHLATIAGMAVVMVYLTDVENGRIPIATARLAGSGHLALVEHPRRGARRARDDGAGDRRVDGVPAAGPRVAGQDRSRLRAAARRSGSACVAVCFLEPVLSSPAAGRGSRSTRCRACPDIIKEHSRLDPSEWAGLTIIALRRPVCRACCSPSRSGSSGSSGCCRSSGSRWRACACGTRRCSRSWPWSASPTSFRCRGSPPRWSAGRAICTFRTPC